MKKMMLLPPVEQLLLPVVVRLTLDGLAEALWTLASTLPEQPTVPVHTSLAEPIPSR
jgi:hypothetical protein